MLTLALETRFREIFAGDWFEELKPILSSEKFMRLGITIARRRLVTKVYPETTELIFRAFTLVPLESVYVVILGQDPYHDGSADGLAFSNAGKKVPSPSLKFILQEVQHQIYEDKENLLKPEFYDLSRWAKQGVFLLNTSLTVEAGKPNSHKALWTFFTKEAISVINDKLSNVIFLLWGKQAQSYEEYIDKNKHHVMKCGHPIAQVYGNDSSWKDNGHFRAANDILRKEGNFPIIW